MKGLLVIFLVGVSSFAFSQSKEDRRFSIDITEFAMFFDFKYYINNDSIYIVKKTYLPKEVKIRFTHKWTEPEKKKIDILTKQIELETLNSNYQGKDSVDDNSEFVFYFNLGGREKKIMIYNYKLLEIFSFVEGVNKLLPDEYKIGYNDQYFSR